LQLRLVGVVGGPRSVQILRGHHPAPKQLQVTLKILGGLFRLSTGSVHGGLIGFHGCFQGADVSDRLLDGRLYGPLPGTRTVQGCGLLVDGRHKIPVV
jgi:hypothetical protein